MTYTYKNVDYTTWHKTEPIEAKYVAFIAKRDACGNILESKAVYLTEEDVNGHMKPGRSIEDAVYMALSFGSTWFEHENYQLEGFKPLASK